jgi:hypothetical protein
MNRRTPTILSVLFLLLVLSLALFLRSRAQEPPLPATPPAPQATTQTPAPPAPPAPAAQPVGEDRQGLVGPSAIAGALPALQSCWAEHGQDEGLEPGLTLVFTIGVDAAAPRRMARVQQVRVKAADDSTGQDATPFEACAHQAVDELALVAPGGRDSIAIPMAFQLGSDSP